MEGFLFYLIVLILFGRVVITRHPFYYSLSLIIFSVRRIWYLFSMGVLSSILRIIILIIYVGAIMVIVGYICSVCPNFLFESSFSLKLAVYSVLVIFLLWYTLFSRVLTNIQPSPIFSMSNYYYRRFGVFSFTVLVAVLLLLLVVASISIIVKSTLRGI